jgi:CRP/FNR family transcriptional regulator
MPIVGAVSGVKTAQEMRTAAVVGSSKPIVPFSSDFTSAVTTPTLSKNLPAKANLELDEIKRTQYYQSRSILFHQGEQPSGVFILKCGAVKLSITSSKGRVIILRIAQSGEILALSSVLSGEPCIATAETLQDCEVAYVEREQFLQILLHNPEAALCIAFHMTLNYKMACRQVSLLGLCRSASERLAQFLLNWSSPKAYCDGLSVWLGLTHEEISQVAGTTRETVTRTLGHFRKKGWASLAASKLVIQNREAIEKLVA